MGVLVAQIENAAYSSSMSQALRWRGVKGEESLRLIVPILSSVAISKMKNNLITAYHFVSFACSLLLSFNAHAHALTHERQAGKGLVDQNSQWTTDP